MQATETYANFIERFNVSSVSPTAVEHAKNAFIDTIAVMIAAKDEPVVTNLLTYLESTHLLHEDGQSTIIPFALKTNPRDAAWVMGTMAHALDYDDTSPIMHGHPSAVLIPAILSLAEAYQRTGRHVLEAYICGLEVIHQLAQHDSSHQYDQGWHTTATYGVMGATAAATKMIGLNEEHIRYALGMAASSASGLRANFGTMTKPLHAGQASSMGVLAALLAEQGVTANTSVLEDQFGYGDVFHHQPELEAFQINDLYLETHGMNVKMYPSCSMTHRPLDALFSLVSEYDIKPDQIEAVECSISRRAASILRYHEPEDAMQAKFSLEYCIASAVLNREVSLRQFYDDQVKRADIQTIMKRVNIVVKEDTEEEIATVVIKTKEGSTLSSTVTHPIGSSGHPLTREQLKKKFSNCVDDMMTDEQQQEALAYLEKLEELSEIQSFLEALTLNEIVS